MHGGTQDYNSMQEAIANAIRQERGQIPAEPQVLTGETCPGCGHSFDSHVHNIKGGVICLVEEHGRSTDVIMDYHQRCDCKNYRSEREERRKKAEAEEKAEHDAHMEQLLKEIKKSKEGKQ